MSTRRTLFAGGCAAMFVFGVVLAMPGALFGIAEFRTRLGVNLAQQGDVFFALYAGVLLSTLIAGPLIDAYGNKPVLALSAAISAAALAGVSTATSYRAAILFHLLLGLGSGPLNTSANALVAELYGEDERPAMLNVVAMFFGAGALTAALLATRVAPVPLLRMATLFIAACAAGYASLAFPPARGQGGFSPLTSVRAARIAGVMLLAIVCFCESGDEASLGGWISTYAGPWALVAYLLPFTMSRLAAASIARRVRPIAFIIGCALVSSIGCALIVASRSLALAGAVVAGIAVAPVYPAVLTIAAKRYAGGSASVFGLLFAIGLSGGVVFPFAVGHIAQHAGVRFGMLLPLAGGLAIAALIYAGNRTSNAAPPPSPLDASTVPP